MHKDAALHCRVARIHLHIIIIMTALQSSLFAQAEQIDSAWSLRGHHPIKMLPSQG